MRLVAVSEELQQVEEKVDRADRLIPRNDGRDGWVIDWTCEHVHRAERSARRRRGDGGRGRSDDVEVEVKRCEDVPFCSDKVSFCGHLSQAEFHEPTEGLPKV